MKRFKFFYWYVTEYPQTQSTKVNLEKNVNSSLGKNINSLLFLTILWVYWFQPSGSAPHGIDRGHSLDFLVKMGWRFQEGYIHTFGLLVLLHVTSCTYVDLLQARHRTGKMLALPCSGNQSNHRSCSDLRENVWILYLEGLSNLHTYGEKKINLSIFGNYLLQVVIIVQLLSCVRLLCDHMDRSIPGFSVLHYLPEFAQIHIH